MKQPLNILLTALLLAPLAALHAADSPFLRPPQHLGPPRADQVLTNRAFAGIPCMASEPDAAQPAWSTPRRIGDGVMMCKPLILTLASSWAWRSIPRDT